MMHPTIGGYIKAQEADFETREVQVGDNWSWNLRKHVQMIFHLKNGVFFTGENQWLRAFKNIMEPMLNLAYWTEDIEVKDVTFFIESPTGRALSFLVKKYHDEVFVREHNLDTLFDQITESDIDYGGVLVQKTGTGRPERIVLNTIAFCDQTDMLGAPIGFKFQFAPEKLKSMAAFGWGDTANGATIGLTELSMIAGDTKEAAGSTNDTPNKVPGRTVEVYVVRGTLPEAYLEDNGNFEEEYAQVQVVAFYVDQDNKKQTQTLYRAKDDGKGIKFHTSQEVYGRALGRGTGEALLPPQIWTNFLTIHKMNMLGDGAKTPLVTDDPSFSNKNRINEMENNEIVVIEEGRTIKPIPTINPTSIQLYEGSIDEWYQHAQLTGAAFDPMLGKEGSSGTTFRGQERTVAQGRGLHDRRRGQRAKFIEELYRDWIIPAIAKKITRGASFLATLTMEEMQWVVDQLTTNHVNRRIIDGMLEGKLMTHEERDLAASLFRENFLKGGNKKLLKILKEDFKDVEIKMGINIAGKQKDLVNLSDKLLSVFQFVFANPQGFQAAMQMPALSKAFGDILEFSGLNQSDFSSLLSAPAAMMVPQGAAPAAPGQAPMTMGAAPVEA